MTMFARWRPDTSIERGQLTLLFLLALLTVGSWGATLHLAHTMRMPMGVVVRGGVGSTADDSTTISNGVADPSGRSDQTTMAPDDMGMAVAASSGMTGMEDAGWTWDGFLTFAAAWAAMMAAMMFPTAAPMLLIFRHVATRRGTRPRVFVLTWLFASGYLLVWVAAGAVTWLLVRIASDLAGRIGEANRADWAPLALAVVLLVAGLYQLERIADNMRLG